jgi:hypothetical protein
VLGWVASGHNARPSGWCTRTFDLQGQVSPTTRFNVIRYNPAMNGWVCCSNVSQSNKEHWSLANDCMDQRHSRKSIATSNQQLQIRSCIMTKIQKSKNPISPPGHASSCLHASCRPQLLHSITFIVSQSLTQKKSMRAGREQRQERLWKNGHQQRIL